MEKLNVYVEKGKLSIDIYDLLGALTDKDRSDLIDSLACREEVITEVANQIIDGFTTDGSHGPTGYGGNPDASYGIDGARMRIAKASSEIAAREIERLAEELKRTKARIDEGWNAYHNLMEQRRYA